MDRALSRQTPVLIKSTSVKKAKINFYPVREQSRGIVLGPNIYFRGDALNLITRTRKYGADNAHNNLWTGTRVPPRQPIIVLLSRQCEPVLRAHKASNGKTKYTDGQIAAQ